MIKTLLSFLVSVYQIAISPFTPPCCRFQPTCSEYAHQAIQEHGLYGLYLTLKRLLRCQPWGNHGYDPVPHGTQKTNTNTSTKP